MSPLVRIRPGRYSAKVFEGPNGERRQGPWIRLGYRSLTIPEGLWIREGERVVYRLNAVLRAPNPVDMCRVPSEPRHSAVAQPDGTAHSPGERIGGVDDAGA